MVSSSTTLCCLFFSLVFLDFFFWKRNGNKKRSWYFVIFPDLRLFLFFLTKKKENQEQNSSIITNLLSCVLNVEWYGDTSVRGEVFLVGIPGRTWMRPLMLSVSTAHNACRKNMIYLLSHLYRIIPIYKIVCAGSPCQEEYYWDLASLFILAHNGLPELYANLFSRHASPSQVCVLWRSTKEVKMLGPTRFVVDATENSKEGGVAAKVCRSQTGLWTKSKGGILLLLPGSPKCVTFVGESLNVVQPTLPAIISVWSDARQRTTLAKWEGGYRSVGVAH